MNNIQSNRKTYGWGDCPEPIKELVSSILRNYHKILGTNLIGFYLHGSLAMDCFNPLVSDVDFLAVVKQKPTVEQKKTIIDEWFSFH